jgi:hypothetical protein
LDLKDLENFYFRANEIISHLFDLIKFLVAQVKMIYKKLKKDDNLKEFIPIFLF